MILSDSPAAAPPRDAVAERHRRASAGFGDLVRAVTSDQWDLPTPCSEWTVRDLVNHVVAENLWTPPLLDGRTIADVGEVYDGDVLGDDPIAAWDEAAARARSATDAPGATERVVYLSFGATPAREYLDQLVADHLLHGWDLAQAIGADDRLDASLVDACARWFDRVEDMYRQAGAIGPRVGVSANADAQTRLLARFGRSDTLAAVVRFNAAFARRDADAVMEHMTDDCVFESTDPAPDGRRYEGSAHVRRAWRALFEASPTATFDAEEVIAAGDRAVVRWTYRWDDGHVRGVDVLRVRDGKVAEKLSYVKG